MFSQVRRPLQRSRSYGWVCGRNVAEERTNHVMLTRMTRLEARIAESAQRTVFACLVTDGACT